MWVLDNRYAVGENGFVHVILEKRRAASHSGAIDCTKKVTDKAARRPVLKDNRKLTALNLARAYFPHRAFSGGLSYVFRFA